LDDAAAEGYNVVGFSGGEPTIYPSLVEALTHAHAAGMRTTVTSNGMLLSERLLDRLHGPLDLLAISLDGVRDSHNVMRGSDKAFDAMERRLEAVRKSGIAFGFLFTLTQHNLHELAWVAKFAAEQGAGLLQVHPLEETGRARRDLAGSEPDAIESSVAFLETARLRGLYGETLRIQLDLLDRRYIAEHPERVFAAPLDNAEALPLSAILSPLIVEPDGMVVPINFGLDRRFAFGSLYDRPLRELAPGWRADKMHDLFALCRETYDAITAPADLPFVNWYPLIDSHVETATIAAISPTV
jgi:MoaA/NifB/PqqE/SkfB family radical SAM enzyme